MPEKPPDLAGRAPTEKLAPYAWTILGITVLVHGSAAVPLVSISPLAPFLQDALGISRTQIGLLASVSLAGSFVSLLGGGLLADRLGARRIFLAGLLTLAAALGLAGLAGSFWTLCAALLVANLGSAAGVPATARAIVFWFPPRLRGLAMGLKQAGSALAGVTLGIALPVVAGAYGWQGGFFVVAVATVVIAAVVWIAYRESAAERASRTGSTGHGPQLGLLQIPELRWICAFNLLAAGVQISVGGFLVLFLQESFGLPIVAAGGLFALSQVSAGIGRIGWGVVSDTVFGGRRRIVLALIVVCAILSMLGLIGLPREAPGVVLGGLVFVLGATSYGWNGVQLAFVAEISGRDRAATAAGLSHTASALGGLIAPPLFGWIVDRSGSYAPGFYGLISLELLALLVLTRVRRGAPRVGPDQ